LELKGQNVNLIKRIKILLSELKNYQDQEKMMDYDQPTTTSLFNPNNNTTQPIKQKRRIEETGNPEENENKKKKPKLITSSKFRICSQCNSGIQPGGKHYLFEGTRLCSKICVKSLIK